MTTNTGVWRTHPYRADTYVWIDNPPTVYAGTVSGSSFTYPVFQLNYSGASGSLGDVKEGHTIIWQDSAGKRKAFLRVRKVPTASTLYVNEFSAGECDVDAGDTFRILDEFRLWSKTPRFDTEGNQYKDYDITVGDKTYNWRPYANAGAYYVGTVDPQSLVATVPMTGIYSDAIKNGNAITAYNWDFVDGTPSSGTVVTQDVIFPPGRRYASLTVTDSDNNTHTAYCLVVTIDGTVQSNTPAVVRRVTMDVDAGASTEIELLANDTSDFLPGSHVMVYQQEWFDGTVNQVAAIDDRTHIKFNGYIDEDATQLEPDNNSNVIRAINALGVLQKLPAYEQVIEFTGAVPASWYEAGQMNFWKMVYYLLRYHSTALEVVPLVPPVNRNQYDARYWTGIAGSLYDQIQDLAKATGVVFTGDRRGVLWMARDPRMAGADRPDITNPVTLGTADFTGDVTFNQRSYDDIGWLRASGLKAETSAIVPLFSVAPGKAPSQGLQQQTFDRLLPETQAELNIWSGTRYAFLNRDIQDFRAQIYHGGMYLDPAWMYLVEVDIPASSNRRGFSYGTANYTMVQTVETTFDHESGAQLESWTFVPLPDYAPGATEIYIGTDDAQQYFYQVDIPDYVPLPDIPLNPIDNGTQEDAPSGIAVAWSNPTLVTTTRDNPAWQVVQEATTELSQYTIVDEFSDYATNGSGDLALYMLTGTSLYYTESAIGTSPAVEWKGTIEDRTLLRLIRGTGEGSVAAYGKSGTDGSYAVFDFISTYGGTIITATIGDGTLNGFGGMDIDDFGNGIAMAIAYNGTRSAIYTTGSNGYDGSFYLTDFPVASGFTGDTGGTGTYRYYGVPINSSVGFGTAQIGPGESAGQKYADLFDPNWNNTGDTLYGIVVRMRATNGLDWSLRDDPVGAPGGFNMTGVTTPDFYAFIYPSGLSLDGRILIGSDLGFDYTGVSRQPKTTTYTVANGDPLDEYVGLLVTGTTDYINADVVGFIRLGTVFDGSAPIEYNTLRIPYREYGDNSLNNGTDAYDVLIGANGTIDGTSQWLVSFGIDGSINGTINATPVINGTYYYPVDSLGNNVESLDSETKVIVGNYAPTVGEGTYQLLNEDVFNNGTSGWSIIGTGTFDHATWSSVGNQAIWFSGHDGIGYTPDRGVTAISDRTGDYALYGTVANIKGVWPVG